MLGFWILRFWVLGFGRGLLDQGIVFRVCRVVWAACLTGFNKVAKDSGLVVLVLGLALRFTTRP